MAAESSPNATLYVRNLDEKVKIPALQEALREIFGEFGEIIDIVTKKNIKAKGQAFIVYSTPDDAQDALDSLQGFDLFDRPMDVAFARTRSDATVKNEDGEEGLDLHKRKRLAEKERKQALEAQRAEQAAEATETQGTSKRSATETLAERPAKKPGAGGAMPDEYLPPNKILLLRDLPEDYGKEQLTAVFQRYPGFKEIRTVPGRTGIGFAEYEDENGAISAKEAMNGVTLGGQSIRVTFQRA